MTTNSFSSFAGPEESVTPTEEAAFQGLLAAHDVIVRQLDARLRAAHQLGLSAYGVLLRLSQAPDKRLRMTELAAATPLTLSGVSRMVDRLESAGMVRREPSLDDGRVSCAALTSAGMERLRAARMTYVASMRRLFLRHFSDEELATLGECWRRLELCTDGSDHPRAEAPRPPLIT